jgi:hypothetical protein
MRQPTALLLLVALGWLSVPAHRAVAQEQEWSVSLSSASGRYIFDQPTVSHVLTMGAGLEVSGWRLGALWPLVVQNSSAITFIGGAPLPTGGPGGGTLGSRQGGERIPMRRRQSAMSAREGERLDGPLAVTTDSGPLEPGPYVATLGDPIVSVGRDLLASPASAHRVSATGYVKLPVADASSGVGSGALDAGASLSYGFAGRRNYVFLDVGYWHIGDLADQPLRDIGTGALGVGRLFGWEGRWSLAAVLSASSSVVATVRPPMAVSLSLGWGGSRRGALTAGTSLGLSEASPDWSAQLGWRMTPGRAER